jgi:hypothetical protein
VGGASGGDLEFSLADEEYDGITETSPNTMVIFLVLPVVVSVAYHDIFTVGGSLTSIQKAPLLNNRFKKMPHILRLICPSNLWVRSTTFYAALPNEIKKTGTVSVRAPLKHFW